MRKTSVVGALPSTSSNGRENNRIRQEDWPIHNWYRFVLSFPPHLVRKYLNRFGVAPGACVLDPFCGTGTTLVECRKLGVASVGLEPNHMTYMASQVKVDWDVDPNALLKHAKKVADRTLRELRKNGFNDIPDIPPLRVNRGRLRNLQKLSADESKLLLKELNQPASVA